MSGEWFALATLKRTERLLAYQVIRPLVARYAFSIDTRDLDTLVALFIDDVALDEDSDEVPRNELSLSSEHLSQLDHQRVIA